MFSNAINIVGNFTRPILTISREYKSQSVVPGAATIFFVNDEGCAITCKHVADIILAADKVNAQYNSFKQERSTIPNDAHRKSKLKKLEEKYGYHSGISVEIKNNFCDCVDSLSAIDCILHPIYDLAIIKFRGFQKTQYSGHAVFAKDGDSVHPGDYLCRLGYPFPEYTGYLYDMSKDCIDWEPNGNLATPRFPIEGMLTRHISGQKGEVMGFELSTPGLCGQSGGPLFNADGVVYGMQSKTRHLHLGFDMTNETMLIQGKRQVINNQPFLHVGECVHVDIIKSFLTENSIRHYVGNAINNEEVVG